MRVDICMNTCTVMSSIGSAPGILARYMLHLCIDVGRTDKYMGMRMGMFTGVSAGIPSCVVCCMRARRHVRMGMRVDMHANTPLGECCLLLALPISTANCCSWWGGGVL